VEGAEEAPRDELEQPLVVARERARRQVAGRDDREVVRDLGVVEDAAFVLEAPLEQALRVGCELAAAGERAQHVAHHAPVVRRQAARIGARIGEQLVRLVAALRRRQRAPRRPAEAAVALALQAGEVEERRRRLARRLARLAGGALAALRGAGDLAGARLVEEAIVAPLVVAAGVEGRIEPGAHPRRALALEVPFEAPVGPRHVGQHLGFAVDQQREGRRLHAARRPGRLLAPALQALGEGAGGVHADQPVRVGAALRRRRQAPQLGVRAQRAEALADGGRRHRLQPEPLDGLLATEELDDLPEDQLALAAGIAGVHQPVDVLALQQLLEGSDAVRLPLLLLELVARRDHRQVGEGPALVLGIDLLGLEQLEEVTHGEAHDVVVALPEAVLLPETSQRRDDVASHARLLGDDQGLGHALPLSRS
jgi:hypothetical protein